MKMKNRQKTVTIGAALLAMVIVGIMPLQVQAATSYHSYYQHQNARSDRQKLEDHIQATIDHIDAKLKEAGNTTKDKANQASAATKEQWKKTKKQLEKEKKELNEELKETKTTSKKDWEKFKYKVNSKIDKIEADLK